MFIGIIIFWVGMKHYKHADVIKPTKPEDTPLIKIVYQILLPAILFGVIGWQITGNIFGSDSTDAFIFACLPIVFFYGKVYYKSSLEERKPIGVMYTIFVVVIIFWAVFKQNGTALTTWANKYTDREVPASLKSTAATMSWSTNIKAKNDSLPCVDEQFRPITENGKKVMCYDYPTYYKNLDKSKYPPEGESVQVFNTELFQSINPGWVVALTPLVVGFFAFLRKRKKEPSIPTKIAFGLLISALSPLVMVAAVYIGHNGMDKVSPLWLFGTYGVITIGELFLSPMGLSMVSKLSPVRLTALMMGGWFLATSIGNKLSGVLAAFWDGYDNKTNYFLLNVLLLGCAALVLFLMLKRLNGIIKKCPIIKKAENISAITCFLPAKTCCKVNVKPGFVSGLFIK
jgi:POT family proton-dependent oligopeptide transporter